MPGGDGTGPLGLGPLTGFGRGICAGTGGVRPFWGRGRGIGYCRWAAGNPKDELLSRKALLEKSLKAIEDELERLQ